MQLQRPRRFGHRLGDTGHFERNLRVVTVDIDRVEPARTQPAFDELCYFDPRLALNPVEAMNEAKTPAARQRLAVILWNSNDLSRFSGGEIEVREEAGKYLMNDPLVPDKPQSIYRLAIDYPVVKIRRPEWTRLVRAIVILEHIGGPDALAVLKEMATGHPDALPTRTAKEAVESLTRPIP